jgi:FG-GAP repeat/Putative Ig domain
MRFLATFSSALAIAILLVATSRTSAEPTIGDAVDISPAKTADKVGTSVTMHGDTLILGTFADDHAGSLAGAAWIYTLEDGAWKPHTKLTSGDDASAGDYFGFAVDIEGDTAVVGAYSERTGSQFGAVYVFTRGGDGNWTRTARIIAPVPTSYFGYAVALQGDRLVVGSWLTSDAWVFEREDGVWTNTSKLISPNAAFRDYFGASLALDGDRILVGASYEDEGAAGHPGAAYVFEYEDDEWKMTARLTSKVRAEGDRFGFIVDLRGDTALIGAPRFDGTGSAYVFERGEDGSWTETLKLDGTAVQGSYGRALALADGTMLIGEQRGNPQRVDVHTRTGDTWTKQTSLERGAAPFFSFGHALTLCGSRGFIGNGKGGVPIEGLDSTELTLADEAISDGTTGRPEDHLFVAGGGVSPRHLSVVQGSLPVTGTLDPDTGDLSDSTYLAAGTYSYTIRVTDGCGAVVERRFETTVNERPQIVGELAVAIAGRPYEAALPIQGGTAPYLVSATSLPSGLDLDPATGVISGTPATAGRSLVTFSGEDASGEPIDRQLTLITAPVSDLATGKAKETIPGGDEAIVRALELLRGTKLDARMKLPKGSPSLDVLLHGPDGSPIALDGALKIKGRKFTLKLTVPTTGRYLLIVRPDGVIPGDGTLTVKATAPKKWFVEGEVDAEGSVTEKFAALPGSTAKIDFSRNGGTLLPVILEMRDDRDRDLLDPDDVNESAKKARLTVERLPGGEFLIRVGGRDGTSGGFRLKIKLKLPRGYGFRLEELTQSVPVVVGR